MRFRVLFFNRLVDGASPADYERWVVERDYPTARAIPSILSYEVVRVDGPLRETGIDYDYIEVVEVTDVDAYRADLATFPGRDEFVREIRTHVGPSDAIHGTIIE